MKKGMTSHTMLILSVALVCLCFYGTALGEGINGNGAGFEIDDNGALFSGDGALSGIAPGDDWAQGASNSGVLNSDGTPAAGFVAKLEVDYNWGNAGDGFDPSQFGGRENKNNDHIGVGENPWTWNGIGGGPQKNDITNTYLHTRLDPGTGDRWVFVGAETRSIHGDSHVDFEFNQAGLLQTINPDAVSGLLVGLGPDGGRTVGDFIISVDFEQGGGRPGSTVRVWDGTEYVLVAIPGPNVVLTATNMTDIDHTGGWGHFDTHGGPTDILTALQMVEAGVNLTAMGIVLDPCSPDATFNVKTRSSQSFTAELKDFKWTPFQVEPCPTPTPTCTPTPTPTPCTPTPTPCTPTPTPCTPTPTPCA